jgi:DNA-binding transcriptional LysR family regulator
MDSEQACDLIEQNALELAVVTLPFENRAGLEFHKIWDDRLMVTCSKDHPLTQITKPELHNLADHPAVLPSHGTFTREAIETAMAGILPQITINLETNYLETIKMMVSVGLGWSVLPHSMLDNSLVEIPIADFRASRFLGTITNPDRSQSKATQAMLKCIDQFK